MSRDRSDIVTDMLLALPRERVELPGLPPERPLAALNIDAEHDFAIALVHAWAAACKNLRFYDEFLRAEATLDTAFEFRSVREIVRLLGYRPKPAVVSSTVVAFTVRQPDGDSDEVPIARGVPIRSVPGPGELENESGPASGSEPQIFETSDDVKAKAAWNSLRLPSPPPQPPFVASALTRWFTVETVGVTPRPGDGVLFLPRRTGVGARPPGSLFRVIRSVEQLGRLGAFRLHLEAEPPRSTDSTIVDPEVHLLSLKIEPFGADATPWPKAPDADREPVGTHAGWMMRRPFRGMWHRPTDGLPRPAASAQPAVALPGAPPPPTFDVRCVEFSEDEVLYAGTDGGGVYCLGRPADFDDRRVGPIIEAADVVWQQVGTGLEDASVTTLAIGPSGRMYAGTRDERVFVWSRRTDRWEPLGDRVQPTRHSRRWGPTREMWPRGPIRSLIAFDAFGQERVLAGTDRGAFRWLNEDKGWRGVGSGLPDWDVDTARSSVVALAVEVTRLDVFAATARGVYRSRWLGYNWHPRSKGLVDRSGETPGVNDLFVGPWGAKGAPVMFAATDLGVFRSDNRSGRWESLGEVPLECLPVYSLAVGGYEEVYAGTAQGVIAWTETTLEWRKITPRRPSDPRRRLDHDPNVREDPMVDVHALAGHPRRGEIAAAMHRGDFLEIDWPGFWIHFPFLDVPLPKQPLALESPVVLRDRRTRDVLVTTIVASTDMTRADFGLDHPIARLQLDLDERPADRLDERFPIRSTDVYTAGSLISVITPSSDRIRPVRGLKIRLDADADVPPAGRLIAVSGRPARVRVEQLGGLFELRMFERRTHPTIGIAVRPAGLPWCDVRAVAESSEGVAYAVLDGHAIYARNRLDHAWRPVTAEFPAEIATLAASPDGRMYAVDGKGALWRRGRHTGWQPVSNPPPGTITAVAAGSNGGLFALTTVDGATRLCERSGDGSWPSALELPADGTVALATTADDHLVVATSDGSIWVHEGAGDWVRTPAMAFTDVRSMCLTRDGHLLVATRPVLHLSPERGEPVAVIEPARLFDCTLGSIRGLPDGSISKELRDQFATNVADVGDLTVVGFSGDLVLLTDDTSHLRYAVRSGKRGAVVFELPAPLRIDRDRVPRLDGMIDWHIVTRSGRSGRVSLPPRLLSFVHARDDDPEHSEVAEVERVLGPDARHRSTLRLRKPLSQSYDGSTVVLNANAVEATAGSTVTHEPIGSGDAELAHQSFRLANAALVYTGNEIEDSTLVVEVSELVERTFPLPTPDTNEANLLVRWTEVDALVNAGPDDRVYEVRQDDEHRTTIHFGDGRHGARLPTGHGNVVATYRHAKPGAAPVKAGELTLVTVRPRGVTGVTNPIPSSGGKPADDIEDARVDAPRSTRSNGRVVSLRDFVWFCEEFEGIERACATRLGSGGDEIIHVSVATLDGHQIDRDAPVLGELAKALDANRAVRLPQHLVRPAWWRSLSIDAELTVDARYDSDEIARMAFAAVHDRFGVARAEFGVGVAAADVIGLLQSQVGVLGVELATFTTTGRVAQVEPFLPAPGARTDPGTGRAEPAVLIAVRDERDVTIRVAKDSNDE